MDVLMQEAIATWFRCGNCGLERVSPDIKKRRDTDKRPFPVDGIS